MGHLLSSSYKIYYSLQLRLPLLAKSTPRPKFRSNPSPPLQPEQIHHQHLLLIGKTLTRNGLALLDLDADIGHSDPSSRIAAATPAKVGQNLNDPRSHDHFSPYISSCNGLVCFSENYTDDPKLVCNPVTGQSISLPPSPIELPRPKSVASGIGFDRATGQYKVVRILDREPDPDLASRIGVEIYTLLEGNGSWRDVGEVPSLGDIRDPAGLFVDGELHWWMYKEDTYYILCMDIGRENFYTVQLPEMLTRVSEMIDWKGCLGIVENLYGGHRFTDIWVLKDHHPSEEGKKKMSTWTKDISIQWDLSPESRQLFFINSGIPDDGYPPYFFPLGVQKNGEILVLRGVCLLGSYNLQSRQFTIIEVECPSLNIGHIASFVSL